jgi:hypothetical protein
MIAVAFASDPRSLLRVNHALEDVAQARPGDVLADLWPLSRIARCRKDVALTLKITDPGIFTLEAKKAIRRN